MNEFLDNKQFLRGVKNKAARKEKDKEFCTNIFWLCLEELCPRSCCGKQFCNGETLNPYNLHHDQVPLIPEEKNDLIRAKGFEFVRRERDGIFYVNFKQGEPCPFLKRGKCQVQDMKPSLCKAYPLVQVDSYVGPVFDRENCPGFDVAGILGVKMSKDEYATMLESYVRLQEYRLGRIRLEIETIRKDHANRCGGPKQDCL